MLLVFGDVAAKADRSPDQSHMAISSSEEAEPKIAVLGCAFGLTVSPDARR
jgi:hypothetical protein